jgi:hypothetical protein
VPAGPSLLDIQREQEAQEAQRRQQEAQRRQQDAQQRAAAAEEEARRQQQEAAQQYQQSFLELQQEQQQQQQQQLQAQQRYPSEELPTRTSSQLSHAGRPETKAAPWAAAAPKKKTGGQAGICCSARSCAASFSARVATAPPVH